MQATCTQAEITNLEALFGDMEEQLTVINEPVGIDPVDGPMMITTTTITATRVSVLAKC